MAIVKRFKELLDLDEIDVFIDDVDKSKHILVSATGKLKKIQVNGRKI